MSTAGANTVMSWVRELTDLEEQIVALQEAKRDFYAAIREEHGKPVANGLKAAMRIHRMDHAKRAEAEQIDEETFRILSIIEGHRASRATRARENIEKFDPETGELDEPAAATETAGDYLREPAAVVSGQIVREGDAPRETDRQAGEQSPGDGDASCPDTHFEPPAFLVKDYALRPHCLHPEMCGGSGANHCRSCLKARDGATVPA